MLALTGAGAMIVTGGARAAGPALVDDAGVVSAGSCELEAFINTSLGPGWRRVFSPTCGFTGLRGWEIGVIAAQDGPGGRAVPGVAAKAALVTQGSFTLGVELSAGFDPEGNSADYLASNLAATLAIGARVTINANAGLDQAPGLGVFPTWGIGAAVEPRRNWWLVGEVAGRQGFRTRWQAGIRHVGGPWQFDAMLSHAIDEARTDKWITLGVTYSFAR